MNLNTQNWKEFRINKLFDVVLSKGDIKEENVESGPIRLISSGESNNGVVTHIDCCGDGKAEIFNGNVITADMFCNVYYQDKEFYSVSHGRVNILLPKFKLNFYIGMFLSTIINNEKFKYSYGRALYRGVVDSMSLKLPTLYNETENKYIIDEDKTYSDEGYIPDWQFMESYIKSLHYKPISTTIKSKNTPKLNVKNWKEFTLNRIFTLKGGFFNKKPEHSEIGTIPFLASTENNNGVTEYYSYKDIISWNKVGEADNTIENKLFSGNCIVVTVNGSVCNAFYQREQFTCSHDITQLCLRQQGMNEHIGQFLCTVIMMEKYRWSYGRKPHDVKKFGMSIIKLPIKLTQDKTPFIDDTCIYSDKGYVPDWQFMEDYIKSLPYSDRIV